MKIIKNKYPPNIEDIKKHFPITPYTVFTYGDTLYVPSGGEPDRTLLAHESTHAAQQLAMGEETWWKKYFKDKDFRVEQEIKAYGAQFREYKKNNKSQLKQTIFLSRIGRDMASDLYGNVLSLDEAIKKIKEESIKQTNK